MGRIFGIGGKQHHGKTIAATAAAPYAFAFVVDVDAYRASIETRLGVRPLAACALMHDPSDSMLGIVGGVPKIRAIIENRTGSIEKPPKITAGSATWAASIEAAKKVGVDPKRVYVWSQPSSHEGANAGIWLPHDSILIDDWQFIVTCCVEKAGDVVRDKNGEIDSMKLGAHIGVPIRQFFIWLGTQPISVVLTSHLKKPGKVRDGIEIDAGSIAMPTRTGAGEILATFEMVTMLRPAAATVERIVAGEYGVKVTGGRVGSELDVLDADDDLDFDAWVAKPATVLEGLESFSNLFVHFPPGDPGGNNWLTRDRSGVLWAGGCPGALYGLYAGAGKSRNYPFRMPKFIAEAAEKSVSAEKAEDLYRIAAEALQNDSDFSVALQDTTHGGAQRRLALLTWALHEGHAAWVAANYWRNRETGLFGKFMPNASNSSINSNSDLNSNPTSK